MAGYDIIVMYEDGPENLKHLLYVNDYDAIITVGRQTDTESGDGKRIQDVPLRYSGRVPISVTAIDRAGYTAAELLNEIRWNMTAIVHVFADTTRTTVTITQSEARNTIEGGYDPLWIDKYIITFRPTQGLGGLPVP
jgi:hypothetical protein